MRKWWPLVTVCLGTFMLLVDVTIVNVALPNLAVDVKTSFSSIQWVIDAYALALAALLLGIGSAADLFGHRRSYVVGLAVFGLSSLACGLAPNAAVLIAARAVQGVGAAAMFATVFALLNSSYQGRDRGVAYGMWGAVAGASAAIGPIVGGLLTEGISWRWIFFVNVPVSVVTIVLCFAVLPVDRPERGRRIDVAGTITFTVAAAALTIALIRANEDGWTAGRILGLFALAAAGLLAFVLIERRSRHAMLDLGLFRSASFVGVLTSALLINFAAFAALTYSTIWLQSVVGLTPIQSGLTGLPLSAAAFLTSALIGRFLHRGGAGFIIGGGMLLIGIGSILDAVLLHSGSSWPALVAGFVIGGVGVGLATPTLSSAAMSAVPPHRGGMAAGTVNTARQLGYAIGIAVLGSVFTRQAGASLADRNVPDPDRTASALAGGQAHRLLGAVPADARGAADRALHAAAASGLDAAFLVAGLVGIATGLLVLVLVRPSRRGSVPADRPAAEPTPEAVVSS